MADYQSSLPPITLTPEEELKQLQSNPTWRQRVMNGDLMAGKEFDRLTDAISKGKLQKQQEAAEKARADSQALLAGLGTNTPGTGI